MSASIASTSSSKLPVAVFVNYGLVPHEIVDPKGNVFDGGICQNADGENKSGKTLLPFGLFQQAVDFVNFVVVVERS